MSYAALSLISCRTQCTRRHACFVCSLARAPSLLHSLHLPLLPFHTNHAPLQSITTAPSSCPPSPSSSHHFVLHPPPSSVSGCHWRSSFGHFRGCWSICSRQRQRTCQWWLRLSFSSSTHIASPFFSYHCVKVKKKKEAIVQGGVKGMRGRYITTKGGMWLVERDAGHS